MFMIDESCFSSFNSGFMVCKGDILLIVPDLCIISALSGLVGFVSHITNISALCDNVKQIRLREDIAWKD